MTCYLCDKTAFQTNITRSVDIDSYISVEVCESCIASVLKIECNKKFHEKYQLRPDYQIKPKEGSE